MFNGSPDERRRTLLDRLQRKSPQNKTSQKAKDYLLKWVDAFWKETDYQITEMTTSLENEIDRAIQSGAELSIANSKFDFSLGSSNVTKLTESEKKELQILAQPVVDRAQLRDLAEVIDFLRDYLIEDRQKRYFILIDRLDERWVHDELRYRLIRALLEAVRYINSKIENVKVIVALREDLFDRVFRFTRSVGDQQEKYTSLLLKLYWDTDDLKRVVDHRVDRLLKDQYTKATIVAADILPAKIRGEDSLKYLVERTLRTPRDMIVFFNYCLQASKANTRITQQAVLEAETTFSEARLRAVADEWSADYADITSFIVLLLKQMPSLFKISDLHSERLRDIALKFVEPKDRDTNTYIYEIVMKFLDAQTRSGEDNNSTIEFRHEIIKILYKMGVIGVKLDTSSETSWSYTPKKVVDANLDDDVRCYVHRAFWRVLGIQSV